MWVSDEGQTPGWDLQFAIQGELVAIEVKGTSGEGFLSFELTANELRACQELGLRYKVLLVADCLGATPRVQVIHNPAALLQDGHWTLQPVQYRVTRVAARSPAHAPLAPTLDVASDIAAPPAEI
jgi:hypothetical protein